MLSVGADVQFRIWDPVLSVMAVKDLNTATRMTAHNAMTKALLRRPLQEIQMERLKIGDQLLVRGFSQGAARSGSGAWPSLPAHFEQGLVLVLWVLAHYMSQHYYHLKRIWVRPHVKGQR